jgi:hypothetical protein
MTRKNNALRSIRKVWSEMDDAQRRMFEIRTGIPVRARSRHDAGTTASGQSHQH